MRNIVRKRLTRQVDTSTSWTILSLSLSPWFFFSLFFSLLTVSHFSFAVSQDLFKRPVVLFIFLFFFSKRSLKQARMSNFSPFCRALLPFHYCLLTGTFLHYYQEARVGIDTYVYYLLATCLYLNSSDRLPDTRTTSNGRNGWYISLRWQPLGYLSRKLRNKSILLQASLFLHRLEPWSALVIIY